MSKLGITLPAFALMSLAGPSYAPRTYSPKTYDRRGETGSGITNLALLPASHAGLGAPAATGCVGVSQTFTTPGSTTYTFGCNGTLFADVWASGAGGQGGGNGVAGGAGAFASGPLVGTVGTVVRIGVGTGGLHVGTGSSVGNNGSVSVACLNSDTHCSGFTLSSTSCIGVGLTTTNAICAAAGLNTDAGGSTANSVGVTLFKGGTGGTSSGSGAGAGGPDGAGQDGTIGNTFSPPTGGAGDNGSGGTGGAAGVYPSTAPGAGGASSKGGGGGGGPASTKGANGGAPGGSGSATGTSGVTAGDGAAGRVVLRSSLLDPATEDAMRGYSPGNVGTVSMA